MLKKGNKNRNSETTQQKFDKQCVVDNTVRLLIKLVSLVRYSVSIYGFGFDKLNNK